MLFPTKLYIIYILVGVLSWLDTVAESCPSNLVKSVFICFNYLESKDVSKTSAAGAITDAEMFEMHCVNSDFTLVVQCVNELYDKCRHSRRLQQLKELANPESMLTTFENICNRIGVYRQYSSCIEETKQERIECTKRFQYGHVISRYSDHRKQLNSICRFMKSVPNCSEEPIRRQCGKVPADIIKSFISVITPPYCKPYSDEWSSATTISHIYFIAISLILFSLLFI